MEKIRNITRSLLHSMFCNIVFHTMFYSIIYINIVFIYINLQQVYADLPGEVYPRILYGDQAKIEDHPYFAGLVNCGAVIISDRHLLTAAHCFDDKRVRMRIRHAYVGGEAIWNSRIVEYENVIIHHDYLVFEGIPFNDIAVIRLKEPLEFSNKVQPIKLPMRILNASSPLVFIGRGTDESGNLSNELRQMDVESLTVTECVSLIPKHYQHYVKRYKDALSKINICGKRTTDKPGICYGDSGSPLVQDGTIVGLASYGGDSCEKGRLGFYVNVAYFADWIRKVTGLS